MPLDARGGTLIRYNNISHNTLILKSHLHEIEIISLKKDWYKRSNNYLTEAKKDNDFIYHERIPEVGKLAPIGKAAVVKATEVPDRFFPQVKLTTVICPQNIILDLFYFDVVN